MYIRICQGFIAKRGQIRVFRKQGGHVSCISVKMATYGALRLHLVHSQAILLGLLLGLLLPEHFVSWLFGIAPGASLDSRPLSIEKDGLAGIHCLRMRQLPQESWGSRYLSKLVSIIIVNDVIAQIIIIAVLITHLWTRLATSFVVMA